MERIVIHELRRYKLVTGSEQSVETRASGDDGARSKNLGMESKLVQLLCQTPITGWTVVKNPDIIFKIADENRVKVSDQLLKELNPSAAFFERRKKMKGGDGRSDKKKRKKGKPKPNRKPTGRKNNG